MTVKDFALRNITEIIKDKVDIVYNAQRRKIFYRYTEFSSVMHDITDPLLALYYHLADKEVEHWREDVCNAFNLPVDMLFPVKEKIGKYNFVHDKKPKVYISGQITGLSEKEYKNNFNSAELYLTGLGYDVVNPVAYDTIPNGTWSDYMRRDIKLLMDCDYIYMLDNWTESTGAKAEFRLAIEIGIERLKLDT